MRADPVARCAALEKAAGVLGLFVGCGVGAVGGLGVSTLLRHEWEPWILPNRLP